MSDTRCIIGEYCAHHRFIHGAEAEELREGLEKLLSDRIYEDDGIPPRYIQLLLDDVDARDSAAFVSTPDGVKPKRSKRR